jgi:hypothetical protein
MANEQSRVSRRNYQSTKKTPKKSSPKKAPGKTKSLLLKIFSWLDLPSLCFIFSRCRIVLVLRKRRPCS